MRAQKREHQVPPVGTQTGVNKRAQMSPSQGKVLRAGGLSSGVNPAATRVRALPRHSLSNGGFCSRVFLFSLFGTQKSKARSVQEAPGQRAGPRPSLLRLDWQHLALRTCVQGQHLRSCSIFTWKMSKVSQNLTPHRSPHTRTESCLPGPWAFRTW